MNKKLYWIIRQWFVNLAFQFKRIIFILSSKVSYGKQLFPLRWGITKTVLLQLLVGLLLTLTATHVDAFLLDKYNASRLDLDVFKDIVLGGMGIAGVILGLYCANISSIFSAKYTNAPNSIAQAFQTDIVTNSCIKQIICYIVVCVIQLYQCISEVELYYTSILLLLLMTTNLVITFSVTGNRTYVLSDAFKLAYTHYRQINTTIWKISNQRFFARDISFQNHLQKMCTTSISGLLDIAKYTHDIPASQNTAMTEFMSANIFLICNYWQSKCSIYYKSRWFCEKPEYKQWHYASDFEVSHVSFQFPIEI